MICFLYPMKEITRKWAEFASADLEAAEVQLQHGSKRGSAYQVAVFHCHQAIEKILKAHLVEQDQEVKKIHDLTTLRASTKLSIPEKLIGYIDELQPHYLIPRYPDLPFTPKFSFTYNRKNVDSIFKRTQEVFIWLTNELTQKK